MTDSIHQEVTIKAKADRVYAALTDGKIFSEVSGGAPATIAGEAGGEISLFGGQIVGRNLEMIPGKRLVQAWRPGSWDDGVFSVVRFELQDAGDETRVILDHTGVPDGQAEQLEAGWHKMYWEPLNAFLG